VKHHDKVNPLIPFAHYRAARSLHTSFLRSWQCALPVAWRPPRPYRSWLGGTGNWSTPQRGAQVLRTQRGDHLRRNGRVRWKRFVTLDTSFTIDSLAIGGAAAGGFLQVRWAGSLNMQVGGAAYHRPVRIPFPRERSAMTAGSASIAASGEVDLPQWHCPHGYREPDKFRHPPSRGGI